MNILAFTDLHYDLDALKEVIEKAKNADVLVGAGDYSDFGHGLKKVLSELGHKVDKPIILVHGNHESVDMMEGLCKDLNIHFLHRSGLHMSGYSFFGYGGGGFSEYDALFEKSFVTFLKGVPEGNKVIVVTHSPPAETKVDYLARRGHVGNKTMRKVMDKYHPDLWICGHLHENVDKVEVVDKKTVVINPGPDGRMIKI